MLQIRIGNRMDGQGLGFGGTQILRYIKIWIFYGACFVVYTTTDMDVEFK